MQKIISVFQRNYDTDRLIRDEVVPGAEWVLEGRGTATRKWDGSCAMIRDGRLYKRYELKKGKQAPAGFEEAQEPDSVTGDIPGWLPVGEGPEDKWFRAAWMTLSSGQIKDGTYEAVGPHFQGGIESFPVDTLVRHGVWQLSDVPRDFDGLREYLRGSDIEGIVFYHPDGRMAKVKKKDFGIQRRKSSKPGVSATPTK